MVSWLEGIESQREKGRERKALILLICVFDVDASSSVAGTSIRQSRIISIYVLFERISGCGTPLSTWRLCIRHYLQYIFENLSGRRCPYPSKSASVSRPLPVHARSESRPFLAQAPCFSQSVLANVCFRLKALRLAIGLT